MDGFQSGQKGSTKSGDGEPGQEGGDDSGQAGNLCNLFVRTCWKQFSFVHRCLGMLASPRYRHSACSRHTTEHSWCFFGPVVLFGLHRRAAHHRSSLLARVTKAECQLESEPCRSLTERLLDRKLHQAKLHFCQPTHYMLEVSIVSVTLGHGRRRFGLHPSESFHAIAVLWSAACGAHSCESLVGGVITRPRKDLGARHTRTRLGRWRLVS